MIDIQKILSIISMKGPVLPVLIAKEIGTNILMASACMSELVDSKKLMLSNTKIGGSPVYYVKGQEPKLQNLYEHLNEKDKRAFDLLKDKKVLKDSELEPLMRVAFRNIKDFAIPLQVTHNNMQEIFWKWYMLNNDEAESLIRAYLQPKENVVKKEEIKEKLEEKPKEVQENVVEKAPSSLDEEKKKLEEAKKKFEEEKQKMEKEKEKIKQEKKIEQEKHEKEQQKELEIRPQEKKEIKDSFFEIVKNYFSEKKIGIESFEIIRKKAEIDTIIQVPSVVGNLDYYCKAKNKKRISDSDLSAAFVQGQLKKLPVLFLTTGELTKKAEELLKTEFKKGLVVKRI